MTHTLNRICIYLQSDSVHSTDAALEKAASNASNVKTTGKEKNDDIMSVLLAHEKQNSGKLWNIHFCRPQGPVDRWTQNSIF